MKKTLFFQGDKYLAYGFPNHPLSPARHLATLEKIKTRGLFERKNIIKIEAEPVSDSILKLFHTEEYIQQVKSLSLKGSGRLDPDTPAFKGMFDISRRVVGSSVKAVELVLKGKADCSFNMVGGLHHAREDRAAGFCVFNDAAVVIAYALKKLKVERILYVDMDAHHGDGVFYGFYNNPRVWIGDIHQNGRSLYPGTGFEWETGEGMAVGTKMNFSLHPGASDKELLEAIDEILNLGKKALPQIILLQAGTDGIEGDPITALRYTINGHLEAVKRVHGLASELCDGRLVVFGGGGYNINNTTEAWTNILDFLSS